MCDYSLMALSNRLAVCGDELVVHKFETGAMGLAAYSDVCRQRERCTGNKRGVLGELLAFLKYPYPQALPAVCVPPGARLLVRNISASLQNEIGLQSSVQEVVFTQTDLEFTYRDAIRFSNGKLLSLQKLSVGQRISVLSVGSEDANETVLEGQFETTRR
jgi:hypothetical protein